MNKQLHIISLDVPWPADYGGVIDIYYRIKALHESGTDITLHCFTKDRRPQKHLEELCKKVFYYPRKKSLSLRIPYIVASRSHPDLLMNLNADEAPILIEGVHCSRHLFNNDLSKRKVFLRLHNVEYCYYLGLATGERNLLKRVYFHFESILLERYENRIAKKAMILGLNGLDLKRYADKFGAKEILYLPAFAGIKQMSSKTGSGSYCLYHGNLSVNENDSSALWLIKEIFSKNDIPLVIAGKKPSERLKAAAAVYSNISIVPDPYAEELNNLIENAAVNVLPTKIETGIKLKLVHAIFKGRHCISNYAPAELGGEVIIAEGADAYRAAVAEYFEKPFTEENIITREALWKSNFNDSKNAALFNSLI